MALRRGAEAAADASKGGGQFDKTHFFGLDDGKTAIVRFLTDKDDWIVVDQHQSVPTKRQPADYPADAKWPEKMGSVCRKDPGIQGLRHEDPEGVGKVITAADCFICDHVVDGKKVKKPGGRTWAVAVMREEVKEGGQVVGIRDQTREIVKVGPDGKPSGETTIEKAFVVVNMGYKNFFGSLTGFANHYGTAVDRDYLIKRVGSDETTIYNIIPLDPIQASDGQKFDPRRSEIAERYAGAPDLEKVIVERANDEFYARFFDTRVEAPARSTGGGSDKGEKAESAPASAPQADGADADRLAALAGRVKGYGAGESAPAEQEKTPAAAGGMRSFD